MRALYLAAVICLLSGCAEQKAYDKLWSNYDWLPPDAQDNNPYAIRRPYPSPQQQRYPAPAYDNDSDYVQPYNWGMCGSSSNLGSC